MKKILVCLLTGIFAVSLVGCGADDITLDSRQNDLIAEYIAGEMLKFSYDNEWKYTKVRQLLISMRAMEHHIVRLFLHSRQLHLLLVILQQQQLRQELQHHLLLLLRQVQQHLQMYIRHLLMHLELQVQA